MNIISKLKSVIDLLGEKGPAKSVSKRWLFRTSSKIENRFKAKATIQRWNDEEFQYFRVNGKQFVWPKNAPEYGLLQVIAELLDPAHPHHYEWGPTRIQRGDHVLDIGCCEGGFAAQAVEIGASVTAIEPSKLNAELIKKLFDIRKLAPPKIIQCLLGKNVAELHFEDNVENPGASMISPQASATSYPVQMVTLDQLIFKYGIEKVDFIKCDAEGSDVEILKSGIDLLRNWRPKIAVTTYHRDGDFEDLYNFLIGLGYRVTGKGFFYSNGKLRVLMLHAV